MASTTSVTTASSSAVDITDSDGSTDTSTIVIIVVAVIVLIAVFVASIAIVYCAMRRGVPLPSLGRLLPGFMVQMPVRGARGQRGERGNRGEDEGEEWSGAERGITMQTFEEGMYVVTVEDVDGMRHAQRGPLVEQRQEGEGEGDGGNGGGEVVEEVEGEEGGEEETEEVKQEQEEGGQEEEVDETSEPASDDAQPEINLADWRNVAVTQPSTQLECDDLADTRDVVGNNNDDDGVDDDAAFDNDNRLPTLSPPDLPLTPARPSCPFMRASIAAGLAAQARRRDVPPPPYEEFDVRHEDADVVREVWQPPRTPSPLPPMPPAPRPHFAQPPDLRPQPPPLYRREPEPAPIYYVVDPHPWR